MSPAVTTGLFTLFGVIVGGLLNFLVSAGIEERRARRTLRTAARILGEELTTNNAILRATLSGSDWAPMGNAPLKFNAWEHYRQAPAERLPDSDWETLRAALRQAQMIDRVHRLGDAGRPLSPADVPHLGEAQETVGLAVTMLERYSTVSAPER